MKKHITLMILAVVFIIILTACNKTDENDANEAKKDVMTKNSSEAQSKQIESKDIASFNTHFYLWDQFDETVEGSYSFAIEKNNNGEYVLKEDDHYGILVTVDKDILDKLQTIIDDTELALKNGFHEYTSGLPEEFAPCMLSVVYESGEKLYFSEDNDPEAKWSHDMWELFKNEFINQGHDELLPPVEDTTLVSFEMGFTDGKKEYLYNTIFMEDDIDAYSHHYSLNIYNRETGETECDMIVQIPENFYEDLAAELNKLELKKYQNGEVEFGGNAELDRYAYFCMEMLSGLQINAYYEGEDAKELTEILAKVTEYIDSVFD